MNAQIASSNYSDAASFNNTQSRTHFYLTDQKLQLQNRMRTLRNEPRSRQASHNDSYLCPANNGSLAYGLHLERQFVSLQENKDASDEEAKWFMHLFRNSRGTCLHTAAEIKKKDDARLYEECKALFDHNHGRMMAEDGFSEKKEENHNCDLKMATDASNHAIERENAAKDNVLTFNDIQELKHYVGNHDPLVFGSKEIRFADDEISESRELQKKVDIAKENLYSYKEGQKKAHTRNWKSIKTHFQQQQEKIPCGYVKTPFQGYLNFRHIKSTMVNMFFIHGLAQDSNNPSLFTPPLEDEPGKHSVEFVGALQEESFLRRYVSEIFYAVENAALQGTLTADMLLPREDYFVDVKGNTARCGRTKTSFRVLFKSICGDSDNRTNNKILAKAAQKKMSEAEIAKQIDIMSALRPGLAHFLTKTITSSEQSPAKRKIVDYQWLSEEDFLQGTLVVAHENGTIRVTKRKNEDNDDIPAEGSKQRRLSAPGGLRRATNNRNRHEGDDDIWTDKNPKQRTFSAPAAIRWVRKKRRTSGPNAS